MGITCCTSCMLWAPQAKIAVHGTVGAHITLRSQAVQYTVQYGFLPNQVQVQYCICFHIMAFFYDALKTCYCSISWIYSGVVWDRIWATPVFIAIWSWKFLNKSIAHSFFYWAFLQYLYTVGCMGINQSASTPSSFNLGSRSSNAASEPSSVYCLTFTS